MYALLNANNCILGLTHEEIGGTTGWVEITQEALTLRTGKTVNEMMDNLSGGEGIPLYKIDDGYVVPRTQEEMDADRQPEEPTTLTLETRVEKVETSTAAMEEQLDMLLTGATADE